MKKPFKISVTLGLVMTSLTAQATLTPTIERGDKNVYYNSPNGVAEVCVIPKHYPEADYKKKDLNKETELCNYSFYPVSENEKLDGKSTVQLEAKLNSTNPGVNIYGQIQPGEKEAEKIGKYKNSTSCSYTPSILGYYHVSRILGGIGRVPVSVLRSMDIEVHKSIAAKGAAKTKTGDLINTTWNSLLSSLKSGLASQKKDLLMTDDGRQSYGAFIVNPKGEEAYKDLFTPGPDRAVAFRDKNPVFALVKNKNPLASIVSSKWSAENVQKLLAMRDTTEFIVLDHLLNQQDRFGNIAYQSRVAYVNQKANGELNLELAGDMKDVQKDQTAVQDKQAVTIKSMVLKDNDCGVSKTNVVQKAGLLARVAHMSPKTYRKVLEFQRNITDNQRFFTSNLMFTASDFSELVANVDEAAGILQTNCRSGALKLDLDVDQYLTTGSVQAASCDID